MPDTILQTRGLTRRFDGLVAVDNVSLQIYAGERHAIIGPNGAGKTTLINLLSGDLEPSAGTIHFQGADITHAPAYRVNRVGIGRSYQKTNIFPAFTCFENCWMGAVGRLGHAMRFLRPARSYKQLTAWTEEALEKCGLADARHRTAAHLSHGEQRQLEIAMTLATGPDLLLLDEPLAGMGQGESQAMVDLMLSLSESHSLVLIEHDMDAVFALADRITVLDGGRVLETGTPDVIRESVAVREAYLGDGATEGGAA